MFSSPQNGEQKGDGKIVPGLRMVLHFTETWFRSLHPQRDAQPLVTPVPGAPVSFFDFCGLLREHGAHTYTLSHTHTLNKYVFKRKETTRKPSYYPRHPGVFCNGGKKHRKGVPNV